MCTESTVVMVPVRDIVEKDDLERLSETIVVCFSQNAVKADLCFSLRRSNKVKSNAKRRGNPIPMATPATVPAV